MAPPSILFPSATNIIDVDAIALTHFSYGEAEIESAAVRLRLRKTINFDTRVSTEIRQLIEIQSKQ